MTRVFLGLGSNIGDRLRYLQEACRLLESDGSGIVRKSSLYQSEPWGNSDQPYFYNAVIEAASLLEPEKLLAVCQKIEAGLGRQRLEHWGPRTIDIDILLYDDLIIDSQILKVPHPYLTERAFVLYPLYEIAPDLIIPGKGVLKDFLKPDQILELVCREW